MSARRFRAAIAIYPPHVTAIHTSPISLSSEKGLNSVTGLEGGSFP